jgi:hypothetical protein
MCKGRWHQGNRWNPIHAVPYGALQDHLKAPAGITRQDKAITRQDKTTTRQDKTRQGTIRQDKTRQDTTRQDNHKTGHDKTRQDKTRQDTTRQDTTGQDKKRQNTTRQDETRQDKTRQDKTRQDKTRQDKTKQDKTKQDKMLQNGKQKKLKKLKNLHFDVDSEGVNSLRLAPLCLPCLDAMPTIVLCLCPILLWVVGMDFTVFRFLYTCGWLRVLTFNCCFFFETPSCLL